MANLIHWIDCDEWIKPYCPIPGKEYSEVHVTRRLVCDHSAVERVWFTGNLGLSDEEPRQVMLHLEMLLRNGEHISFSPLDDDCFESGNIPVAEHYLARLSPFITAIHNPKPTTP
jgi:hypothetical protein